MVEVKGERVLTASCIRKPTAGMEVQTQSERAAKSREMVFELLASNMRPREEGPDNQAPFWQWAVVDGHRRQRPLCLEVRRRARARPESRPLESRDRRESRCVHRVRRLRARVPRGAGQRRDRHGAARQPRRARVRHPRPDGPLDLRHVRRMRAGVPDRRALREVADGQDGHEARRAEVRQGRRHAVPVLRRRLSDGGRRQGQPHRAGRRPQRLRERESALRQRPLRLRLRRVARAPDEAADPPRRRAEVAATREHALRRPLQRVPRSHLGRGADARRRRAEEDPRRARRQGAVRLRLGEGLERGGVPVPEARAHGLRDEQRRSLHAALPCVVRRGAHGRHRLGRRVGAVQRRDGRRVHHRHRRAADREPSGRRHVLQASGEARREADRHRSARPGPDAPRDACAAVQARQRRRAAELAAAHDHRREALRRGVHSRARLRLRSAEGQGQGFLARSDGRGRRHRGERAARRCAHLRDVESVDHLLGHGHLAAHARHRQRALLDRARVDHRPDRPAGHGPASAARPEQRAGRFRRRA